MAHYAFVNEDNLVVGVIVGRDEYEIVDGISNWEQYYSNQNPGLKVIQTSYNTRGGVHYDPETGEPSADQSKAFRKNYAGIGYIYDDERDAFIEPKQFDSWILNEDTCLWEAPIPYPGDGLAYSWDESLGDWVEIPAE